jgi:hypothetical protein
MKRITLPLGSSLPLQKVSGSAHKWRNEVVESLIPDWVSGSHAERDAC